MSMPVIRHLAALLEKDGNQRALAQLCETPEGALWHRRIPSWPRMPDPDATAIRDATAMFRGVVRTDDARRNAIVQYAPRLIILDDQAGPWKAAELLPDGPGLFRRVWYGTAKAIYNNVLVINV